MERAHVHRVDNDPLDAIVPHFTDSPERVFEGCQCVLVRRRAKSHGSRQLDRRGPGTPPGEARRRGYQKRELICSQRANKRKRSQR